MRKRVWDAVSTQGSSKSDRTISLVGCSIGFLKKYIESKFLSGMTWRNYGLRGWHIDHVVPCATFDLKNTEDQKKCFHYTNLQPMWWLDNLKKSSLCDRKLIRKEE